MSKNKRDKKMDYKAENKLAMRKSIEAFMCDDRNKYDYTEGLIAHLIYQGQPAYEIGRLTAYMYTVLTDIETRLRKKK